MTQIGARQRPDESGFTLIETLVALALMGLVLSALAHITALWLPNWNRGLDRVQRSEAIGIALQRITTDLAAAEFVTANREAHHPLFDGSELSVTLVRTALGPNVKPGLEVVRIGESSDRLGLATVRSRTPFRPFPETSSLSEQVSFGDPVVLLRAPFRLSFSYAGKDRVWKGSWHDGDQLPTAVRLTVRDVATERVLSVSTVTPIHVQAPAINDCAPGGRDCGKSEAQRNAQAGPEQAGPEKSP